MTTTDMYATPRFTSAWPRNGAVAIMLMIIAVAKKGLDIRNRQYPAFD